MRNETNPDQRGAANIAIDFGVIKKERGQSPGVTFLTNGTNRELVTEKMFSTS